jgi:hypothetical protein
VGVHQSKALNLTVRLQGRGYVRIEAQTSDPWLHVTPEMVGLKSGEQSPLTVEVDPQQVPVAVHGRPTITLIGTNGQQEEVQAGLRISTLKTAWLRNKGAFKAVFWAALKACLSGGAVAIVLSLLGLLPCLSCLSTLLQLSPYGYVGWWAGSMVEAPRNGATSGSAGALAGMITALPASVVTLSASAVRISQGQSALGVFSAEDLEALGEIGVDADLLLNGPGDVVVVAALATLGLLTGAALGAAGGVVQVACKRS